MVVGIALRGLGKALLKKRGKDAASTFMKRREVFRGASKKADREQTLKKFKRMTKDFKSASERAKKFSIRQKELVEQGKKLALGKDLEE